MRPRHSFFIIPRPRLFVPYVEKTLLSLQVIGVGISAIGLLTSLFLSNLGAGLFLTGIALAATCGIMFVLFHSQCATQPIGDEQNLNALTKRA